MAAACGVGLLSLAGLMVPAAVIAAPSAQASEVTITSTGLRPGEIKHVWLIILENKSNDATFSGLNQNTYLWKTLPAQGVLLKNYYGTGHFSMDNYISLVSGQAPEQDTQEDCSVSAKLIGPNSDILHSGSLVTDKNYGQMNSPANASQPSGANAPNGANGCTYPTDVPTLFNQFNAAGVTWKGYAQDIGGAQTPGSTTFQTTVPDREAGACAGPGTSANNPDTNPTDMAGNFPTGVTTFTAAQPDDQFVAKHFPFGWFESLTGAVQPDNSVAPPLNEPSNGGTNCDANHIANLDSPADGLVHDLKSAATTPAFSWITPDNCSDAHDAVCHGNNLSGAFTADGTPNYTGSPIPYDPESTTPKNFTGGLYASDLFLEYYIPLIEQSPAFKQGGLIDVTFDEGFPAFTYTGNSFNNANAYPPTSADKPNYPSSTLNYRSDTVLTGTVQRPALTSQGDGVEVKTMRWSVLVTVTGPEVPGEGLPYQAPATTCTWIVTMADATGPVPVSASDFTSIDAENDVYRPAFVAGQPQPPRVLRPGQTISFELRAVEATGEGLMRWAPDGRNIVAKWDFVVEND